MTSKKIIKEYLSFSRRDRIAVIILVSTILGLYGYPFFLDQDQQNIIEPNEIMGMSLDTLEAYPGRKQEEEMDISAYLEPLRKNRPAELFPFDPNTLDVKGWQKLGLSEKTSMTIKRFRSKGGKFYKPEDLRKIWGLPPGFFEKVQGYIRIAPLHQPREFFDPRPAYEKAAKSIKPVYINSADSSELESLPGIGVKLASRIISFREKLGGFFSIDQVKETYGLSDSTFQRIEPYLMIDGVVKKININTVTKEELRKHPYLKWNIANAIIEYRNQHGLFKTIDELENVVLVDKTLLEKIKPYLVIND